MKQFNAGNVPLRGDPKAKDSGFPESRFADFRFRWRRAP
jgi:hypothetical protein